MNFVRLDPKVNTSVIAMPTERPVQIIDLDKLEVVTVRSNGCGQARTINHAIDLDEVQVEALLSLLKKKKAI